MRDDARRIVYVGKAKNLRNRIRSYFRSAGGLSLKNRILTKRVSDIEFTVTQTELEALLLECNLIKKHRPRYNIRLKDDKNYPYVVLDFNHPFPQFRISRKVVPSPKLRYFGPFSGGVNDISRFLLKTFQIRDCSDSKFKNRTRPCLNYEIGICTAPCVDLVAEESYAEQIQQAILFLKGRKRELLKSLGSQMKTASQEMKYENARILRDKIHSIKRMTAKQSAVLSERQTDVDVIGSFEGEESYQWVVVFVRAGFLMGRRGEKGPRSVDTLEDATRSFLQQFYSVSLLPDEIWVSKDFSDRTQLEKLFSEQAQKPVQIRIRRSGKPKQLLKMAYDNAKLIYEENKKKTGVSASKLLQEVLGLSESPNSIEGIDVSNLQGTTPAVALVHFSDERPLKSRYRLYYPRTVEGQNDFAMIYETVMRRFSNTDLPPPDLLLIDGGKGQLGAALKALGDLKIEIPILALAKARTESAFTRKEVERSEDRIFIPNRKNPILLKPGNPALALVQRVRDEAHRFSVKSLHVRRKKVALGDSPLLEIPGVGKKTHLKLLQEFGSLEALKTLSAEDLTRRGYSRPVSERVVQHMRTERKAEEE